MVQLVCPCLNIRIHGKGTALQLQNGSNLKLSVNALSDSFFSSDVYNISLDLGGVTKAQKLLCSSRCIDGWVITLCAGCDLDVYAKHVDDNDCVLVSSIVEKEPSRITSLMDNENYSNLFKMILPEINDNYIQNNIGIELSSGNLDQTVELVQNQVSNFLRDEQKAMEERIRQFAEQAHSRYAALQQKVRKHKQAMVYLLIKAKNDKKQLPTEPMMESPLASPVTPSHHHSSNDSSSSADSTLIKNELSEHPVEAKVQVQVKSLRRTISYPSRSKTKSSRQTKHASVDVGGVFDMEGFDAHRDSAPFYNSEDDTDISENSAPEDCPAPGGREERHAYATSLPMSVPAFASHSRFAALEEEKVAPLGDPDQIAASMRALAQSVHDGTEMFGDLPRRRLNTGELLRSRPV